ncbi:hypothetical protein KDD30_23380 (plasmid) [Photobacterium sp. GJ3]|uniref:hypothetical protein n=1 Tax=Photobacterium sp. GJ3 TaxID=2829502 RepID=UPI001B8C5DAC|nr:hypothetical protein [Photobacterium sp. GJ3]QUJ69674.1 hypothetical protein KDD30_23380 [Photobacterium sp. GJ3]
MHDQKQSDTQHVIHYHPTQSDSIQQALQQFCGWLSHEQALETAGVTLSFLPETEVNEVLKNHLHQPLMKALLSWKSIDAWQHRDNLSAQLSPEDVFFLLACFNPALKAQLFDAGDRIRLAARALNCPQKLSVNEAEVFGAAALYLIGFTYPEYAYLAAGYVVAGWDESFAPSVLNLPALLVAHHGFSASMLKAFCYCDNDIARGRMFSQCDLKGPFNNLIQVDFRQHVNLVHVCQKEPETIDQLLSLLAQRSEAQPYVFPATDEPHEIQFARRFVLSVIQPDEQGTDRTDAVSLAGPFTETMSVAALTAEVSSVIPAEFDRRFAAVEKADDDIVEEGEESDDEYEFGQSVAAWQEFITGALPQGDALWRYVEFGEGELVQDEIEPCDILNRAREGQYRLYQHLIRYALRREEFDHCLSMHFMFGLGHDWFLRGAVSDDDIELNRMKAIRLLDVIYQLKNETPFSDEMVFIVLGKVRLMPPEQFYTRYGCNWKSYFWGAFDLFKQIWGALDGPYFICDGLLEADWAQAKTFLPQLVQLPQNKAAGIAMLAGVYSLRRDHKHHPFYALSQQLLEQSLAQGMIAHLRAWCLNERALSALESSRNLDDGNDLKQFERPITDAQSQAFVLLEDYLCIRNEICREDAVQALKTILAQTIRTDIDSPCHGYLVLQLGAKCYLSAAHHLAQDSSNLGETSRRFLSLWIEIAPAQVADVVAEQFHVDMDVVAIILHLRAIVGDEIGELQETAVLMTTLIQSDDAAAKPILAKYGARYAAEKQDPNRDQVIHSVVSYLQKEDQQKFFQMLTELYPSLAWYEYFDTALMDEIREEINHRILSFLLDQEVEIPDDEEEFISVRSDEIMAFFSGQTRLEAALEKLKLYQIASLKQRFAEVELSTVLWHASQPLRARVLLFSAALSDQALHDCYDPSQMSENDYAQQLHEAGISLERLLPYLIRYDLFHGIRYLAERHDLFCAIQGLSEHTQLKLLKSLSVVDGQMSLVERFSDDDSATVRDLVSRIRAGQYRRRIYGSLLDRVDEGIYKADEARIESFQRENPEAKVVPDITDYLVLDSNTRISELTFEKILGMKVVYHPEMDGLSYPDEIDVIVRVTHPEDQGQPVQANHTIQPNTEYFLGWYLGMTEHCRPGRYDIEVMDDQQRVLWHRTYHLSLWPRGQRNRLPELDALLDNDAVLRETLPPVLMGQGEITVVDPARENEDVVLPYLLGDAPIPVTLFREQASVIGLAVGQLASVQQWHQGCTPAYMWLERFLKSKTVLVGNKSTLDQVLAEPDQSWQQVSKAEPYRVYQPEGETQESSALIALHFQRQGYQIFFGFDAQEEMCCYFIMSRRLSLWDRLISWFTRKDGQRRLEVRDRHADA